MNGPTEPVSSPAPVVLRPALGWRHVVALALILVMSMGGVGALAWGQLLELRNEAQRKNDAMQTALVTEMREALVNERHALVESLHDIMVPPTNDKLFTILTKAVGVTEDAINPSSVGTTEAAAFTTDLTTAQQSDAYSQLITIINTDGTDNLCYKPIAWATAGATCTLKCSTGSTITCSGAATDGMILFPLQGVTRRYDGTSCICVVGSAAGVTFTSERVLRRRRRLEHRRKLGRRSSRAR